MNIKVLAVPFLIVFLAGCSTHDVISGKADQTQIDAEALRDRTKKLNESMGGNNNKPKPKSPGTASKLFDRYTK